MRQGVDRGGIKARSEDGWRWQGMDEGGDEVKDLVVMVLVVMWM